MKKTLLSVLAGLAVITSASAGIKETCLQNPDKLFWVEDSQACVPLNTCYETKYSAYCEKMFASEHVNFQMETEDIASKVAKNYIKQVYGYDDAKPVHQGDSTSAIDQDFLAYSYDGGKKYVQFEFDDITETFSGTSIEGTVNAVIATYLKKQGKEQILLLMQKDKGSYSIDTRSIRTPLNAENCEKATNFLNEMKVDGVATFDMNGNTCEIIFH